MKLRAVIVLFVACAFAAASHSQGLNGLRVFPTPSLSGQLLTFVLSGLSGCGNDFDVESTATVLGSNVTVVYTVKRGLVPGCFSTPPQYEVFGPIGVFAPGDYTLTTTGTVLGAPQPVSKITFTVPSSPVAAVEFYRSDVDHYFLTADAAEIAKLDSGATVGWKRTHESFAVVPSTIAATSPVCRFYGKPEAGLDSHFYSASPSECEAVVVRFSKAWQYESPNVFGVELPNETNGSCPVGMEVVYRLYNNRSDANHRYVTTPWARADMIAKGWVPEGYGSNGVAMCTPFAAHY